MIQYFINTLSSAAILSIFAFAFQIIYLPSRVFFVALAGIFSITPYLLYTLLNTGLNPVLAIVLTLFCSSVLSLLFGYFNHLPLLRKTNNTNNLTHLVSSLGLYIILTQIIVLVWGTKSLTFKNFNSSSSYNFLDATITYAQLVNIVLLVLLFLLSYLFLLNSDLGLKFRALSTNPKEFALRGYNSWNYYLLAFFLSGLFASVSSLLYSYEVGFDSFNGFYILLLAIISVIVGGRYSFLGAFLGGLILAFIREGVSIYFSLIWRDTITFIFLLFILIIRPYGIIESKGRLESRF